VTGDREIIARIIELVPLYDPETMPSQPSTFPSGDGWGYTLINFCADYLEEEFPGLTEEQFNRCYIDAYEQTNHWRTVA
jgi:hypothetical protein